MRRRWQECVEPDQTGLDNINRKQSDCWSDWVCDGSDAASGVVESEPNYITLQLTRSPGFRSVSILLPRQVWTWPIYWARWIEFSSFHEIRTPKDPDFLSTLNLVREIVRGPKFQSILYSPFFAEKKYLGELLGEGSSECNVLHVLFFTPPRKSVGLTNSKSISFYRSSFGHDIESFA